ncbi:MAG: phosphoribosylanthranilate isomerase [Alphaproteobacteria bacterium]|nr:phosphoribosylanthranilate isomerase [Alphaproteobacteria bacterium]
MTVTAKICGLNSSESVHAAITGGASHIGFVFYPPSPRAISPTQARDFIREAPIPERREAVITVGLFVNADDALFDAVLEAAPLKMLQLHGAETPDRVAALKKRYDLPVMKAISVAEARDIERAEQYLGSADWLLFDAKPPATMKNALPGGNAVQFDWTLMSRREWSLPWMLAGGVNAGNVEQAIAQSGAKVIDVSSGVEDAPGVKNPAKISNFLTIVAAL